MIGLPWLKAQLRVEHEEDDVLLLTYLDAAIDRVRSFTGVDLTLVDGPAELRLAALQLCGHWLENREATSTDAPESVPFGFDELLLNHREWSF